MDIISREEARANGLKLFYTAIPCVNGHLSPRYVALGRCVTCNSINSKRYRDSNKETLNAKRRQQNALEPEKVRQRKQADYRKHWHKRRATARRWYAANRNKMLKYLRAWQATNAEQLRAQKTAYYLNRKRIDPEFAMLTRLRRRINHFVSSGNKSATTAALIGCSSAAFKEHIENLFTPGMTWENRAEWHIDHIIPCAAFDLTDPEQQRACFHYSNMRPLWADENRRKGATMPTK